MNAQKEFQKTNLSFSMAGTELNISAIHRHGELSPIVFLHGFGSTKEDYADILRHTNFAGHPFVAYDAPGCGESTCADLTQVSIPFLVSTALAVLERLAIKHFHLVGHSMGGLTALILAHQNPERVLSFVNIEGNIAPEDCFLSRQIIDYPQLDPERFFKDFIARTLYSPAYASALYAASLPHKVRAAAVPGIFKSMVELSDNGELMSKFLNLACPKMFMYGDQNRSLSYLPHIAKYGVQLAEIPQCGHFPMYSNPAVMWEEISNFQMVAEKLLIPS